MFWLKVLGGAALEGPQGPLRGRAAHKRRLAVLALLAEARGAPVPRERIIGMLWPESGSEAARHTLSESLYVLRKELGDGVVSALGDGLVLNGEVLGSDLEEFRAAAESGEGARAAAAYRGPLLDGFYVDDAPEFERWVEERRAQLAREYAGVLEALAAGCEAAGDAVAAAGWWERLAAHDPYDSRVALRLMEALAAAGKRAAALQHATVHAALLRTEFGTEPDAGIAALADRLRAAGAAPAPPPPPPPPAEPEAERAGGSGVETSEATPSSADPGAEPDAGAPAPPSEAAPAAAAEPSPAVLAAPSSTDAPARNEAPAPAARRRWRSRRVAYAGAAAALAGAALIALNARTGGGAPVEADPRLDPNRIAVLYFDDHSPGEELGYLAGGLTDGLIDELEQVDALHVVPRNGVKPFRDRDVPLDSIARELRVGSVVEGSVQRSGNRIRVRVRLVDAASGEPLESRTIERPLRDQFELEDAIAAEVSRFLRRRLGREVHLRARRAGTESAAARELVLRAEAAREEAARLARESDARDLPAAVRLLTRADSLLARAEELDSRWTTPPVLRGWITVERGDLAGGGPARQQAFAAALGHAARALRHDPRDPEALELRGTVRWRMVATAAASAPDTLLAGAERDLRTAVAGDSSLAGAWSELSKLLRFRASYAEAYQAIHRAWEADAYFAGEDEIRERLYRAALALGRYGEARRWCEEGARARPDDWRFLECRLTLLARDPGAEPDPAGAWRLVAELDRVYPPLKARLDGQPYQALYRRIMASAVLARAGQNDSARAVLARARREAERDAEFRVFIDYDAAYVHLLLGERDEAVEALRRYLAARPWLRRYAARDLLFRELGSDPRFVALVRVR
jgi:DNA-binding SARP family transcriptional activator/TolB-like protein